MTKQTSPQRVVVLGGGYAGTLAAIRLAGRARGRAQVTLVDPKGALVQRLRLHQVATGQDVARFPYAKLTGRRKVEHVRAAATAIDLDRRAVEIARDGERGTVRLPYDRLVYALGSTVDPHGVPGVAEHAHGLADHAAAMRLRGALERLPDGAVVAVAGGGLTGLEAASEIAAERPALRVRLVTAGDLGGWLVPRAREYLGAALERLGVEVVDRSRVTAVEHGRLLLAGGGEVHADVAVWCGGFAVHPLARESGLAVDEGGRVLVDPELRSASHPEVVAAGDAAATAARMACQSAMPAGAHAADTVLADLRGREAKPLSFGFIHQPLSLGRRDGLIQLVTREDVPRDSMLTGRAAVVYKEILCRSAITSMRMERRVPGFTRWLGAGRGAPEGWPAVSVAAAGGEGAVAGP